MSVLIQLSHQSSGGKDALYHGGKFIAMPMIRDDVPTISPPEKPHYIAPFICYSSVRGLRGLNMIPNCGFRGLLWVSNG